MDENKKKLRKRLGHCGVPQCNTYKSKLVSMHRLPRAVLKSPAELLKWKVVLKMGKEFPDQFLICSRHFDSKYLLTPHHSHLKKFRVCLAKGAFPTVNLPKSSVEPERISDDTRNSRYMARCATNTTTLSSTTEDDFVEQITYPQISVYTDSAVQCVVDVVDRGNQTTLNEYINIASFWNTDKKLKTMTGIPSMEILKVMVEVCEDARTNEACTMSFRDRILLTMHKLKCNCSFAEIAIGFQLSDKTAKLYFADTIRLLAKLMVKLIHWQSKERNENNLPMCFKSFPNVRTVLDCTEIRTVVFRCLTCRTCTYSHYKGAHTLKVLIGVSPSGSINFVSKVSTGRSSDKAIFNQTSELLSKLEPGDAVMVDKGFLIADELANAGIEMIRPKFLSETFSKEDVERNTKIAVARVHVERRIARLKIFRVLADKVGVSMIPYINDIFTVITALSNLSPPILKEDKFL